MLKLNSYKKYDILYKNYIKQQEIYFKEFGTESSIKVSEIQKKEILSKRLVF